MFESRDLWRSGGVDCQIEVASVEVASFESYYGVFERLEMNRGVLCKGGYRSDCVRGDIGDVIG